MSLKYLTVNLGLIYNKDGFVIHYRTTLLLAITKEIIFVDIFKISLSCRASADLECRLGFHINFILLYETSSFHVVDNTGCFYLSEIFLVHLLNRLGTDILVCLIIHFINKEFRSVELSSAVTFSL